jgi:hypothetical protein
MPLRLLTLQNLWLKAFSLILATLIWMAIQSNQSDYRFSQTLFPPRLQTLELRCPVALLAPPGNGSLFTLEPSSVVVKVRGEDAVLKKLTPENIQAYVRLADAPNFSRSSRVEVIVPREVTFKEVVPDQVSVRPAGGMNK